MESPRVSESTSSPDLDENEPEGESDEDIIHSGQVSENGSQVHLVEDTDQFTFEMLQVPEFKDIIDDTEEEIPDTKPKLFSCPDVQEVFDEATIKIDNSFNKATVFSVLKNIYTIMVFSRSNEQSLQEKLTKKADEIAALRERIRRDPRVLKTLILAEKWRNEKTVEEQMSKEYQITLNTMKINVRELENKIHSLQKLNAKLQTDRGKSALLEDQIKYLEESALMRESELTNLSAEVVILTEKAHGRSLDISDKIKEIILHQADAENKCLHTLEVEKSKSRKQDSVIDENLKQIGTLERAIDCSQRLESIANRKVKNISATIKSLKTQIKKIESNILETNKKNEHLMIIKDKMEKKMFALENQIRIMKQSEDSMRQQMKSLNHKHETLKAQLLTMAFFERKFAERQGLIQTIRKMEKDNKICNKYQQRLSEDLVFSQMELKESKRNRETQQRILNKTNRTVLAKKHGLEKAIFLNDVLTKRLEVTEDILKSYTRMINTCDSEKQDISNVIRHLEELCTTKDATIRVTDASNDSLVVTVSKLQDLLNEASANIYTLRRNNLLTQNKHKNEIEMNEMLVQLLSFTEAEKRAAIKENNKNSNLVMIMQNQQVVRLSKIAVQYKDLCDLKETISKHLQALDIQKKETHSVREMLTSALYRENYMKMKIKLLTKERDVFGTMIIQKNTEVQLLLKKEKLLNTILERGVCKFQDQASDIQILKLEIRNLRFTLAAKKTAMLMNNEIRHEMVHATRQLQLEKIKCKAIEDFKIPKIHRYFTIKHMDPSQYEMIIKIQKLQKLLVAKFEEIGQKENLLVTRDLQIRNMVHIIGRRSEPGLAEQLYDAKSTIVRKNKQIKALLSEVNILTFDLSECRGKFDEVLGNFKTARGDILKQKRQAIKSPCLHLPQCPKEKPKTQSDGAQHERNRSQFKAMQLPLALRAVKLANKHMPSEMAPATPDSSSWMAKRLSFLRNASI